MEAKGVVRRRSFDSARAPIDVVCALVSMTGQKFWPQLRMLRDLCFQHGNDRV